MGWYANTIFHDTTITEGDYYIAKDLLKETVTAPVKESIEHLIKHDKINARRSETLSKQTLNALETQNQYALEQAQSTRELVEQAGVHNELLQSQNIEMELQTSKLSEVNFNLEAIGREMHNLTSLLDWRLAKITKLLSGMELSLKQLVEIAKTPSQTWAAEQFDIARDAYSNGLYEEALTYIENAISGTGSQTGYIMDHRYHFLKARVLFGNGNRHAHKLVDFTKAEQAFLKAERYSRIGSDKAMSLCGAALSACGQSKDGVAIAHLNSAKKKDPAHAETRYLLSKLHFKNGDIDTGESALREAYDRNIFYVSKSVADAESQNFVNSRDKVIMLLHNDMVKKIENKASVEFERYNRATIALEAHEMAKDPSLGETRVALEISTQYFQNLKLAKMTIYDANYFLNNFGTTKSMKMDKTTAAIDNDNSRINNVLNKHKDQMYQAKTAELPDVVDKKSLQRSLDRGDMEEKQIVIGSIIFLLTFIVIGVKFYFDNSPETGLGIFFTVVAAIIVAAILGLIFSIVIIPLYIVISKIFISGLVMKNADKIHKEQQEDRSQAKARKDSTVSAASTALKHEQKISNSQYDALDKIMNALTSSA